MPEQELLQNISESWKILHRPFREGIHGSRTRHQSFYFARVGPIPARDESWYPRERERERVALICRCRALTLINREVSLRLLLFFGGNTCVGSVVVASSIARRCYLIKMQRHLRRASQKMHCAKLICFRVRAVCENNRLFVKKKRKKKNCSAIRCNTEYTLRTGWRQETKCLQTFSILVRRPTYFLNGSFSQRHTLSLRHGCRL